MSINSAMPSSGADYDPTLAETFDSVHEDFARLRAHCPVAHSNAFDGFWAITCYQDVVDILLDPDTYITSIRNVVPGSAATGRRPPLHLNPPDHTPYRRAIDRALSPSRVAAIEPATRRIARDLAKALVARGEADFVEHFSSPLPALVFGEWMGLEDRQTRILWETARAYVKAWEAFDKQTVAVAGTKLMAMAVEVIAQRRAAPLDPTVDPTSSLLAARDAHGNPFPDDLLAGCVRQVLVVGLVAPPIFLGSIAVHLARDLKLQQQLRSDLSLIPDALEEFLRLYTPYRGFARTARHEVTIRGRSIKPAEPIALVYASANRDESVFPKPNEFLLRRSNIAQHLAFGRGPHMCAGTALARQQLRVALEEILSNSSIFQLCGEIRVSGMPEVGPICVPLKLSAR
jgi:cytochrome P450